MATTLTQLTIAQIQELQRRRSIFAVGKYQGIPGTINAWIAADGIDTGILFDQAAQERFGTYLLTKKRPLVNRYVNGDATVTIEQAQLALSQEFASLPKPSSDSKSKVGFYDGDSAGNRALTTSGELQQAMITARGARSLQILKNFIAGFEGVFASVNIIPTPGDRARTPEPNSVEYFLALTGDGAEAWRRLGGSGGGVPTNATVISSAGTSYFENVYTTPLNRLRDDVAQNFRKALLGQPLTDASGKRVTNPTVQVNGRRLQDVVSSGTGNNGGLMDIRGESLLLGSINDINVQYQEKQKSIQSRVDELLPAEAAFVVQYDLFEFFPDKMREKMSINAGEGVNPNYSHAWRSPGKLAVTANITIPGASGFRIGQIFWIGRTYEHYKKEGAFQLFGLTETIDLSRGWTTELYARFNAIPRSVIATANPI